MPWVKKQQVSNQSTVILGKCPLTHHFYVSYHLVRFDLYVQSTLHHVSKHNFILKTNQFIDVRCKKWGDVTIFSKSSTVIFITISAWCQSSWIFQCNGFRRWLNTATWLNHRKQFFKGFKIIFPYRAKRVSCITSCLL